MEDRRFRGLRVLTPTARHVLPWFLPGWSFNGHAPRSGSSVRLRPRESQFCGGSPETHMVPMEGDAQGHGRWVYEFTADNPGQLPIGDVLITISFTLDVERFHYDGSIDKPTRALILATPVLAGGKERTWDRILLMNFKGGHAALENTCAVICLTTRKERATRKVAET